VKISDWSKILGSDYRPSYHYGAGGAGEWSELDGDENRPSGKKKKLDNDIYNNTIWRWRQLKKRLTWVADRKAGELIFSQLNIKKKIKG